MTTTDWHCPICKAANRSQDDAPFGTCMICLNDIAWFDIHTYNSPEYRYIGREMVNGQSENACPKCGYTWRSDWCYYCEVEIPA